MEQREQQHINMFYYNKIMIYYSAYDRMINISYFQHLLKEGFCKYFSVTPLSSVAEGHTEASSRVNISIDAQEVSTSNHQVLINFLIYLLYYNIVGFLFFYFFAN